MISYQEWGWIVRICFGFFHSKSYQNGSMAENCRHFHNSWSISVKKTDFHARQEAIPYRSFRFEMHLSLSMARAHLVRARFFGSMRLYCIIVYVHVVKNWCGWHTARRNIFESGEKCVQCAHQIIFRG